MRRELLATALGLVVASLPSPAQSCSIYSVGGKVVKWNVQDVGYYLDADGWSGMAGDADRQKVIESFEDWEAVSCATVKFTKLGDTSVTSVLPTGAQTNDKNEIIWKEGYWEFGSYVLGVTSPVFDFGGTIKEADIALNGTIKWSTSGGGWNSVDVKSVAIHEIGHLFGLQHNLQYNESDPPTMAPTVDPYGKTASLHQDDINGICFLYPVTGYSCTSDSQCPYVIADDENGEEFYSSKYSCKSGSCVPGSSGYVQPGKGELGANCTSDADCKSPYFCIKTRDGSWCTQWCSVNNQDCPSGFACYPVEGAEEGICVSVANTKNFGEYCLSSAECKSPGFCLTWWSGPICSKDCTDVDGGTGCPAGYTCLPSAEAPGGKGACYPGVIQKKDNGKICNLSAECTSGLCFPNPGTDVRVCRAKCNPQASSCPAGSKCIGQMGDAGQTTGGCVPTSNLPELPDGANCGVSWECKSGFCFYDEETADSTCRMLCNPQADACPPGTKCIEVGGNLAACLPSLPPQPLGAPCSHHHDCASGYCVPIPGTPNKACRNACTPASGCPAGFVCIVYEQPEVGACMPAAKADGESCYSSLDCTTQICWSPSGAARCRPPCVQGLCPAGFYCQDPTPYGAVCLEAVGTTAIGAACSASPQCVTGLCIAGMCRQACDVLSPSCPEGQGCAPLSNGKEGACVPQGTYGYGTACETDFECTSLLCVHLGTYGHCYGPCAPGAGSCPYGQACASVPELAGLGACLPSGWVTQEDVTTTPGDDLASDGNGGSGGGGCSAGARPTPFPWLLLFALAVLAAFLRTLLLRNAVFFLAVSTMLLMPALPGCNGSQDQEQDLTRTYVVKGKVVMPAPVTGANVQAFAVLEAGETLVGEGQTDANGAFEFEVTDDGTIGAGAILLLRASGSDSRFLDFWTGKELAFAAHDKLEAALPFDESLETATPVIDPYSTMAWALATALRFEHAKAKVEDNSWASVTAVAAERIAMHLLRDESPELRFTLPIIPGGEEALPWPSGRSVLGLSLAGLSLLASRFGEGTGAEVTPLELLEALCGDLSDSVFDGKAFIEPGARDEKAVMLAGKPVVADTTRYELAQAIHDCVTAKVPNPESLVTSLAERGSLYESVSTDTGELYLDDNPHAFDPLSPTIEFLEATPSMDSLSCAAFEVSVTAKDNQRVAALELVEPEGLFEPEITPSRDGAQSTATVQVDPAAPGNEGPMLFRFVAKDLAGNEVSIERSIVLDGEPPTFEADVKSLDGCVPDLPASLSATAADEGGGIDKVELTCGADPAVACQAEDGTTWVCPLEAADGEAGKIAAFDACGREKLVEFSVCYDAEAPVILLTPPAGTYYSATSNVVTIMVTDNKVVETVSAAINDLPVDLDFESGQGVVELPADPSGGTALLDVWAWDSAGNMSETGAPYKFDSVPPEIVLADAAAPIFQGQDKLATLLLVKEEGSGVAQVDVKPGAGLSCNLLHLDGEQYELSCTDSGGGVIPYAWLLMGTVSAADVAGNVGSLDVHFVVDPTPPKLGQYLTTVLDETKVTASLNQPEMTVQYADDQADEVTWSQETCASNCPQVAKLASRLSLPAGGDVSTNNLPHFLFHVTDDCFGVDDFEPALTVAFQLFHDDTLPEETTAGIMDCKGGDVTVPIAIQTFSDKEEDDFSFAPEALPNRLVVSAVDRAGNAVSEQRTFELSILPPPLFVVAPAEGEEAPDPAPGFLDPAAPKLHLMVSGGATLKRLELLNPTGVGANVALTGRPEEAVEFDHSRAFLPHGGAWTTWCKLAGCLVDKGTQTIPCDVPPAYEVNILFAEPELPTAVLYGKDPAKVDQEMPEGKFLKVPAGGSIFVDIRTTYADQSIGLDSPPETVKPKEGGTAQAYVLQPDPWTVACSLGAPLKNTAYDVPDLLTAYASMPATGSKLTVEVRAPGGSLGRTLEDKAAWGLYAYALPFVLYTSPY